MSRRYKVENCCKNCVHAKNYTGYDDFTCDSLGHKIRAERNDCKNFKSKSITKNSHATNTEKSKTAESIMGVVDFMGNTTKQLTDGLVAKYCTDLDEEMTKIRKLLTDSPTVTDCELEFEILVLANILYFTCSAQEDLGIKEDICKSIRQEVYATAREQSTGKTVADKTAHAELISQTETMTLTIYSRAYKKVKLRVEAGYEMLNSLKKIMNKRIAELELSNSRYINHTEQEGK